MPIGCWLGVHKWVSDPDRDILEDTPTSWDFPHVCTRCGAKEVMRQMKSVQQVIAEGRSNR